MPDGARASFRAKMFELFIALFMVLSAIGTTVYMALTSSDASGQKPLPGKPRIHPCQRTPQLIQHAEVFRCTPSRA